MTFEPERERGFISLEKSLVQREISVNVVFGQKKFLKNQHALLLSTPQCLPASSTPPSAAPSPPLTSVKIVDIPTDAPFTAVTRDEDFSQSGELPNGTATTRPAGSSTSNTGPVEVIVKTTDDAGRFVSLAVRSDSGANLQSLPFENARKLRVLIADDSGLSRKMIERALVPLDMICIHAKDGKDAVEKVIESMKDSLLEESELDAVVPSTSSSQKKGKVPTTATATTPSPRQRVNTGLSSAHKEEESNESEKQRTSKTTTPHDLSSSSNLFTSSEQQQQQYNLQRRIDVVIIDFMMPELDGASAIKAMRDANYEGFVCAVTGSSAAMDYEKLTKSGSSIIMTKPFDVKAFYSCLKGNFLLEIFFAPFLIIYFIFFFLNEKIQIFIVISGFLGLMPPPDFPIS
jgi:CheY-like chemotaxis protein